MRFSKRSRPSIRSTPIPVLKNGGYDPLTAEDFAGLMQNLGPLGAGARLAVAVSGGPDSLALTVLAGAWARERGHALTALTVNHGLRTQAAGEARQVSRWCMGLGIDHHTLEWSGPKPATRVQEAAREARYDLLLKWCRAHGVAYLLLAHHQDDQAETYLMRKDRGSGPAGLAAMQPVSLPPGGGYRWPVLLRPFLTVGKASLEATLAARGQTWVRDPSNEDISFTRVRVRRRIGAQADPEGFRDELTEQARQQAVALGALNKSLARLSVRHLTLLPAGYVHVRESETIDKELRSEFWARVVRTIGGGAYPPRGDRLARFLEAIGSDHFRGATLGGCRIKPDGEGLTVFREAAAIRHGFKVGEAASCGRDLDDCELVWDGRFLIRSERDTPITIRALGEAGVRTLNARWPAVRDWAVPAAVRRSLPGLFEGGDLVGLPRLRGGNAEPWMDPRVTALFAPGVPIAW